MIDLVIVLCLINFVEVATQYCLLTLAVLCYNYRLG